MAIDIREQALRVIVRRKWRNGHLQELAAAALRGDWETVTRLTDRDREEEKPQASKSGGRNV